MPEPEPAALPTSDTTTAYGDRSAPRFRHCTGRSAPKTAAADRGSDLDVCCGVLVAESAEHQGGGLL
eukprot:89064-Rhodomonas_salina.2